MSSLQEGLGFFEVVGLVACCLFVCFQVVLFSNPGDACLLLFLYSRWSVRSFIAWLANPLPALFDLSVLVLLMK